MTIKHVGLIGVGLMGHGIGKNILAKGFALNVMAHKNRAPVESLISLGAKEYASPAEIAKASDMVILCVTGTPQVEEAIYGAKGLATALRDGLIIADCSTAEPASTIKIAAELKAKGTYFVDTPMTRTPKEAEAGKLGLMVAGASRCARQDPARARLLCRYHRERRRCGRRPSVEAAQQLPVDQPCGCRRRGDHRRRQGGRQDGGAARYRACPAVPCP